MKRILAALVYCGGLACATAKTDPIPVKVYQADASAAPETRRMPDGCRMIGATTPFDQMESEKYAEDPYRKQRQEAAAKGGNVLLVMSTRLVTRPGLECPPSDHSANCMQDSGSWNRVSFESYACSTEALAALAALPAPAQGGWLSFPLAKKPATPVLAAPVQAQPVLTAKELESKVLAMMRDSISPEIIRTYVNGQRLKAKLTAEDIIEWKREGIADEIVLAAAAK